VSRAWVAVALLVAGVALAGCSSKAPAAAGPVTSATPTTGVIQGVVVDEAVRPLAGANVTVRGASGATWNATTGAPGTFRIGGLAPGTYVVTVSKHRYGSLQQTVDVRAGVDDPQLTKFQLTFEASSLPYANVYKTEGFHECGTYIAGSILRVCSNINIATWIVVCQDTGKAVCLGNVTQDHSLFLQSIDGIPTFIQSEMSWEPTFDTGRGMSLLIGGANSTELSQGMAYAYNGTVGESPLMLRLSNHESKDNWCSTNLDPPCRTPDTLNYTEIGTSRALLVQVDAGPSTANSGFSAQQPFTMFTTVFYHYEPPLDWMFTSTGAPPQPPQ